MSTPETCTYALTIEEVETLKWALLYSRNDCALTKQERQHIVELENKLIWRPVTSSKPG